MRRAVAGASGASFTKLLLHMNGSDASTTFTDDSTTGHTFTAFGNAQIDTAQSELGGASGLFDGTGDYISTPYAAEHNVAAGDFTVDFWVRSGFSTTSSPFARRTSDGIDQKDTFGIYYSAGDLVFQAIVNTVEKAKYQFTWSPTSTTWYHVALVRNGSTVYFFIDGVSQTLTVGTAIGSNDLNATFANPVFAIGRYGNYNGFYFDGWIDEFRYSVGIARWTSNFTPPTQEYGP